MIHSVLAIPMPTYGRSADLKLDAEWSKGPLRRLDSTGAPAMPVLELVNEELPESLKWTVARESVDLWDSPVEVATDLSIVGLEYVLPSVESGTEILLVHFAGSNTVANRDLLASYTDLSQSPTGEMLLTVIENPSTNLLSRKGVAICVYESGAGEQVTTQELSLAIPTTFDALQNAHGHLAHILTVCASQYFALNFLGWMRPVALVSEDEMSDFKQAFNEFCGMYEGYLTPTNGVASMVYQELQALLGIESLSHQYSEKLQNH